VGKVHSLLLAGLWQIAYHGPQPPPPLSPMSVCMPKHIPQNPRKSCTEIGYTPPAIATHFPLFSLINAAINSLPTFSFLPLEKPFTITSPRVPNYFVYVIGHPVPLVPCPK